MSRFLIVLVAVLAIECSNANAEGPIGRWFRGLGTSSKMRSSSGADLTRGYAAGRSYYGRTPNSRARYSSSPFGFSIGVGSYPGFGFGGVDPYRFDGYGYDPYRYGSFKAPDLLNDPYFQERHRYDSRFPGRYRAPLVVRPTAPVAPVAPAKPYEPHIGKDGFPELDVRRLAPAVPTMTGNPTELFDRLQASSQTLARSLSAREGGEVWMEFLEPDKIIDLISSGDFDELKEVLSHFDGIVGSSELRYVASARGFSATRSLLREYISQHAPTVEPTLDAPAVESLPLPGVKETPKSQPDA